MSLILRCRLRVSLFVYNRAFSSYPPRDFVLCESDSTILVASHFSELVDLFLTGTDLQRQLVPSVAFFFEMNKAKNLLGVK